MLTIPVSGGYGFFTVNISPTFFTKVEMAVEEAGRVCGSGVAETVEKS